MKAFEIIFKSGVSRTLYGKNEEDALAPIKDPDNIDAIIDVVENLKREKEFRSEHEGLLTSHAVLQGLQEGKAKKALYEDLKLHKLIPERSPLAMP